MTTPANRRKLLSDPLSLVSGAREPVDSPIGHLSAPAPNAAATLRLTARAMACEFSVIMNAGEHEAIWQTSEALDGVGELEQQLSVYRDESEVSQLNAAAHLKPYQLERQLFQLLKTASRLADDTESAFDITTDPLIRLWRTCRDESRLPDPGELEARLELVGMDHLNFNELNSTVAFDKHGVSINLGAIGKGYALDRMMEEIQLAGKQDVLLHGGKSSVIARGHHLGCDGWPIGLGNPLMTNRRLGTIVLRDQAMSTSGSNNQYFRIGEKRYGHILNPRTGWPAEGRLSVSVVASSAAVADSLSTAFYVMQLEQIRQYCATQTDIGAIVIPFPKVDRRVEPQVFGVDPAQLYWDIDQVRVRTT